MQTILVALLINAAALGQQPLASIAGTVLDSSGAPVPDATVRLEASGTLVAEARTATDGRFKFESQNRTGSQLVVTATGFARAMRAVEGDTNNLEITLEPARFFDEVNVTSTRSQAPRADPTVTMTVFSSAELLNSAPMTIDDALKTVPGFTLFRRTSSRVSNPTAQGIALRGIGGTGSSRSLVLADGVPLNDAFGGWIYWDKVPQTAIDRIEVQRGSGSDLYGADAVGGVVQIMTLQPGRPTARALFEGGNLGTGRASLFAGGRSSGFTYSAAGQWFSTDGYITYAEDQPEGQAPRGPVDTKAGSEHKSGLATVAYQASNGWHFEGHGNVFTEDRKNGTPVQVNDTDARQGAGKVNGGVFGGLVTATVYGGTQGYDQTFSAVAANRQTEDLNRLQTVPTTLFGLGGQWIRPFGRHSLLVGAEGRFVKGSTNETRLAAGRVLGYAEDGGRQKLGSAFVQGTFNINDRLTMVAGAHGDGWHTESTITQFSTQQTPFSKTLGSFNPRVSFAYRMGESGVSVRGSAYKGFRPPTLNELYRGFRAGNTQTNPNQALIPEKLTGAEGGVLLSHGRASARVTAFWNVLDDAITNITLSTTPALITKQRANADKVRSAGFEFEGDYRISNGFTVGFASAIINANFKGDTSLKDKEVPQVPEYNIGVTGRYTNAGWTASCQFRVTGPQFEDDQNVFTLRRATVFDVYGGRSITRQVQAFVAVENLFDSIYDVGRTPQLTTGLPRAARAGIQINFP